MTYQGPQRARFRNRKLQTGILKFPSQPQLVNTRHMSQRHLTIKGEFAYHSQVSSQYILPRDIIIYLPPSYAKYPNKHFPVIYMHDGNNLFDPATGFMGREWCLDETLEQLFNTQAIPECVVVGIYNSPDRLHEYAWHTHSHLGQPCGGTGPEYARFVVEELMPFIEVNYRVQTTREATVMMGSSLGAVISFYIARAYPERFGKIAMMSPTVYWAQHALLKDVSTFPTDLKLWVDIGTEEGRNRQTEETVESTQEFVHALEAIGYQQPMSLGFYIDYLAGHNEYAWANRVERPLRYLLGDEYD